MRTKNSPVVREQPTFIEAARRAQIIEAALETIAEVGFAQGSLARIAQKAGISKGVIGYYFPSKDDLVRAAVDSFYLTGHEVMMGQMGAVTNATELLHKYITHNLAYIDTNRVGTRAIGEIVSNFRSPDGELFYKLDDTEPLVQGTEAVFAWGQNTGEFRPFDTRVMAVMLRGCVDTFAQQLAAHPEIDVANYTRELIDLFVHATKNTALPAAKVRLKQTKQEA